MHMLMSSHNIQYILVCTASHFHLPYKKTLQKSIHKYAYMLRYDTIQ